MDPYIIPTINCFLYVLGIRKTLRTMLDKIEGGFEGSGDAFCWGRFLLGGERGTSTMLKSVRIL
jgi:hypothetical protein